MIDILSDIDPTLQPKPPQEGEKLLHGPFINPRAISYPALELQIFALEMGCVNTDGFDSKKIKQVIKNYVSTHEIKSSEHAPPQINEQVVRDYIDQKGVGDIANQDLRLLEAVPTLESNSRLRVFENGHHIFIKEDGNSCYYSPYSPIGDALDSLNIAAHNVGIEIGTMPDHFSREINSYRTGGIELSIQSIAGTANYFEDIFRYLGLPDLDTDKYLEMATHAILAHEMMHADLDSMEKSIRKRQLTQMLTEQVTPEELLEIRSRSEAVAWLMEELGEDGVRTLRGRDYEATKAIWQKIKSRFVEKWGDDTQHLGIRALREWMNEPFFQLSTFVEITNYTDANVDFIFDGIGEKLASQDDVGGQMSEPSHATLTQIIKSIGNQSIKQWYGEIWEKGSIPELAKSVVGRLPENISNDAQEFILSEQLPSTVETVVYEQLLSGVLAPEQITQLFTGMDESSFQPILRMYPILFDLVKRNGLTIEKYMEMQSDANVRATNPYSCIREKKYTKQVEEQFNYALMNPIILLGYLVRLDPEILKQVQI